MWLRGIEAKTSDKKTQIIYKEAEYLLYYTPTRSKEA
jgi:hypothetical protein